MLSQRSINRIGRHLENEGWSEEEINEAINEIDHAGGVLNIALPLHFKEEALQHAKCHCKYVLKLKEGSAKYKKAFEDAYSTYLIEAFENSRGVEGPNSGSHRKANPAGIEVFAFDELGSDFIPEKEKQEVKQKAPAGILYMGKDKLLQKSFAEIGKELDKELIKEIATQYSAAVVSLSNTFLFAFGKYKTKRKFGATRIYKEDDKQENTLEFSKKTGSAEDKEKMLQVAYRQIARQIYIICMNSIIAGTTSLRESSVRAIEKGIEESLKNIWAQKVLQMKALGKLSENKNPEMNLAFALNRKTREAIVESFFNRINKDIYEIRNEFSESIEQSIIRWATSSGKKNE